MLHAAPLSSPQDLAWFLAPCARDAKARIETSCASVFGLVARRSAAD